MASSGKLGHFRQWVFWTGIFNIVAYGPLACPFSLQIFVNSSNRLSSALGFSGTALALPSNVNNLVMINTLGILVVFLGILLIIASLDIQNRAWYVFWEGMIRVIFFLLSLYFVIFKNSGQILIIFGLVDFVIGIIYWYYIFTIASLKIK